MYSRSKVLFLLKLAVVTACFWSDVAFGAMPPVIIATTEDTSKTCVMTQPGGGGSRNGAQASKAPVIDLPFLQAMAAELPESPGQSDHKKFFDVTTKSHDKCQMLYNDFVPRLKEVIGVMGRQMQNKAAWVGGRTPDATLHDFESAAPIAFTGFAQKKVVPDGSGAFFWGDLHGGFHSLIKTLTRLYDTKIIDRNFVIKDPCTHFVYLGDYVDRGPYGLEVMYTIVRLKSANADNVTLVRGNHEELAMNHYQYPGKEVSFAHEVWCKLNNPEVVLHHINRFYNHLPAAVYLNNRFDTALCCHGGIDICYDNTALRETLDPRVQFDLFTRDNYNPVLLFKTLSLLQCKNIVNAISDFYRLTLYNLVDDCANDVFQHFFCIAEDVYRTFGQYADYVVSYYDILTALSTRMQDLRIQCTENAKDARKIVNLGQDVHEMSTTHCELIQGLLVVIQRLQDDKALQDKKQQIDEVPKRFFAPEKIVKFDQLVAECKYVASHWSFLCGWLFAIMDEPDQLDKHYRTFGIDVKKLPHLTSDDCPFQKFYWRHLMHVNGPTSSLEVGFLWNYFDYRSDKMGGQALTFSRELPPMFGQRLSQKIFKHQGISIVLRAHQHYGELMEKLLKYKGFYALWNYDNKPGILPLRRDLVCTCQVARSSGMWRVKRGEEEYDPVCFIQMRGPISTWIAHKICVTSEKKIQASAPVAAAASCAAAATAHAEKDGQR